MKNVPNKFTQDPRLAKIIQLAGENALLEAENKELKALARKNNKKGKRKAPKVEKRGRLIMFPIKKQGN